MAVHLVSDGELVVGHVRVEEGETAQRHAVGVFGEPRAGKSHAVMAVIHKGQFAQKGHDEQRHQILRQLPEEQQCEKEFVEHNSISLLYRFLHLIGDNQALLRSSILQNT